jgi:hypothetical protein
MMRSLRFYPAILALANCLLLFPGCRKRPAVQPEVPPKLILLASVLESTEGEFAVSQAKLTYGGIQTKPIETIVLYTSSDYRSIMAFRPFISGPSHLYQASIIDLNRAWHRSGGQFA